MGAAAKRSEARCAWTRPVRPRRRTRRSHLKKGRHAEDEHAALRMTAQRATPAHLTPSSTGKKGDTNDRPHGQLPCETECALRALSRKYRTTHVHPWTCLGGIKLLTGSRPLTTTIGPPYTGAPTSSDPHTPTRTQAHPLHAARSERGDSRVLRLSHALDTGRAPKSTTTSAACPPAPTCKHPRALEYRAGIPRFFPHAHYHPTTTLSPPPGKPPPSRTMEEPPEGFPSATHPLPPAPTTAPTAASLLYPTVPPAPHLAAAPLPAEGVMASMVSAAGEEATNAKTNTNKKEKMSHLWVYLTSAPRTTPRHPRRCFASSARPIMSRCR